MEQFTGQHSLVVNLWYSSSGARSSYVIQATMKTSITTTIELMGQ